MDNQKTGRPYPEDSQTAQQPATVSGAPRADTGAVSDEAALEQMSPQASKVVSDLDEVPIDPTIYGGGNKFLGTRSKKRIIGSAFLAILMIVGLLGFASYRMFSQKDEPPAPLTSLSSEELQGISKDAIGGAGQVTVNSPLLVNSKLTVTPSARPTVSQAGEIYFDAETNRFMYYDGTTYQQIVNGQEFAQLSEVGRSNAGSGLSLVGGVLSNAGVLSLQGQTGDVNFTTGSGISLNGTQIANTGVLSVQGANGNVSFTGGTGISLNGMTITNTGVTSLAGTANQVSVSTANGAVTISLPQNIGTSSTPTFGGLTLGSPLAISSGGTGTSSFTNGGVVFFNGSNLVSTAAPGSSGLCLLSTASGPAFGSCTGSAQVTSVNGLTGALSINSGSGITITNNGTNTITISALAASGVTSLQGASGGSALNGVLTISNATTSGSAITLDTASTSQRGIASFLNTDFSVSIAGQVSLNNIAVSKGGTGKTSFGTNTVLLGNGASGITELAAGTDGQCLISQSGAPVFATCTGAGGVSNVNGKAGAVTLQGGTGIAIDNSGANIVFSNTGVLSLQGTANQVLVSGSTGNITLSLPQNIATTSNVTFNQVTLGLNGNSAGKIVLNGGSTNSVTLQAPNSPASGLTFTLPVTAGANGECLRTDGNGNLSFSQCIGGGVGGGISGSGTTNRLAKFTSGQAVGDSSINDDGSIVTVTVNAAIQGSGGLLIGAPSVAGILDLSDGSNNTTRLRSASLSSNITFTLPGTTGGAGECIKTDGVGNLSFGACLTGGSGSGVNSLIGASGGVLATGDITIANATSTGSTITIDNASTTVKGIASFNATNFSVTAGTVSIANDAIALGANTTGNYVASITAGGGLTGGASSEGASATLAIGAGNGITVNADDIAINVQANKGIEVDNNGISLIDCATDQVLKYNDTGQWACANDVDTGDGVGVTTIGALNGQTKNANGAVISGTTLYLQTADASNSGLVSTSAQTFAGLKTFNSGISLAAGQAIGSAGSVTVQAGTNSDLIFSTSGTGNLVFSNLDCSTSGNGGKLTVDENGVVTCAADTGGDGVGISSVAADDSSIVVDNSDGNNPKIAINLATGQGLAVTANGLGLLNTCNTGDILKYSGTAWECGEDTDTNDGQGVTSVGATDASISVDNSNPATPSLAVRLQSNKGIVLDAVNGIGLINCSNGQVLKYNAGSWGCDTDIDTGDGVGITEVIEGTGIAVTNGNEVSVKLRANQGLEANASGLGLLSSCTDGQVLKYSVGTSSWGCANDTDTNTDTGVTTVGALDSQPKSANGASVVGTEIFLQTADASNVGLVSTSAQAFAGAKTFQNQAIFSNGLRVAAGQTIDSTGDFTIQAAINSDLTIATSGTGALVLSGYDCSAYGGNGKLTVDATGKVICAADGDTDTVGITEIAAGNGISVSGNEVSVNLVANQGLTVGPSGLALMACADNQILKYSTGTSSWGCATDSDTVTPGDGGIHGSGTAGRLAKFNASGELEDSMFSESGDTITLQSTGAIATLTANNGLTIASGGTGQLTLTSASGTIGTASDIQSTGSLTATGAIRSNTGFNVNGVAGLASLACGPNEVLQNATITGGIVTGGSCAEVTAGGDVYLAANNAFTGQSNSFTSNATTQNALLIAANSLTSGSGLKVSTAGAMTSGSLVDISQVSEYVDASSTSASLLNVSRTITSSLSGESPAISLYDVTTYYTTTSSSTLSTNFDSGSESNRVVLAMVAQGWPGCQANPTVSYGGQVMTLASTVGSCSTTKLYYLVNPSATGVNQFQVTGLNSGQEVEVLLEAWYNVSGVGTAAGAENSTSVTGFSTGAGQLIVDFFSMNTNNTSATPGGGQTLVQAPTYPGNMTVGSSMRTAATTMSWSMPESSYKSLQAIALLPVSGSDLALSGALARLSSNCVAGLTSCVDSASILNLQQSNTLATGAVLNIQNAGTGPDIQLGNGIIRAGADSATALRVQSADGSTTLFTANTTDNRIAIGDGAGAATLLVLDSATAAPTGVNGGMFYDTTDQKFKFYQNGAWTAFGTGNGNVAQSGYTAGRIAQFDVSGNIVNSIIDGSVADTMRLQASGSEATIAAGGTNQNLKLQASGTGYAIVGSLLEVQGALRLSVTSANASTYLTPAGSSVGTAINIPYYDPGAFGQIVAMGLPSTAASSARVLSLFDARTSAHQPTITVFSPNESNVFGLSWDGSNTDAYLKTTGTGTAITLQPNGVNGLKVSSTGVTVQITGTLSVSSTSTFTGLITATGGLTSTSTVTGATLNATTALQTGGTTRISSAGVLQNVSMGSAAGALVTNSSGNISVANAGSTGQCFMSNGTGSAPSFQACPAGGASSNLALHDSAGTDGALYWRAQSSGSSSGQKVLIASGVGYTISASDYLEYDVQCKVTTYCNASVQWSTTMGSFAQGEDQNGIDNGSLYSTEGQNSGNWSSYGLNKWYHRKISLSGFSGSISNMYLAMATGGNTPSHTSPTDFWFKAIYITDGAGTIKRTIWNGGQPTGNLSLLGAQACTTSCGPGVNDQTQVYWSYFERGINVKGNSAVNGKLAVGNVPILYNGSTPTVAGYYTQPVAEFGVWGSARATGGFTTNASPDIAETIPAAPDVEIGDLVVPDPSHPERAIKSTKPYDSSALGAISDGTGGFLINAHGGEAAMTADGGNQLTGMPLVLAGRIKIKVSTENGPIKIGDPITTSATPGYGMKATRAGTVVGYALDNFNGDKGQVLVFLNLSYYNPETGEDIQSANTDIQGDTGTFDTLNVSGIATISELHVTGSATVATLMVTGKATFGSGIEVNGHIVTDGDAPTAQAQAAASVIVDGNDTAGTISITTGAGYATGDLASIAFSSGFGKTPRIVLSGQNDASIAARIFPSAKSKDGFILKTEQNLAPNTTYTFDYVIIE